jgi:cell division protein FtsI (penicillin-binding protein 3)
MATAPSPHGRLTILKTLCLLMMALFVGRLFYMQIIQHDKYVAMAQNEQVKSLVVKAKRGEIYALDNGKPVKLVLNENVYTVFVDPTEVEKPDEIVEAVRKIAGGTTEKDIKNLVRAKPNRYRIIAKNVSRQQAQLLREKRLAGLGLQKTTRRIYPEAKLASHVLGFVNAEEKGQYGVEERLDDRLTGKDGLLKAVTDVRNVPLTIGGKSVREPAKDGENIVLSIDRNIQAYVEEALDAQMKKIGATKGSVVVLDPQTGKVLSMANLPDYNPEEYTKVTNGEAFNNSVITAPYEPGSVMKTFTIATALDKGVMTPESTYNNTDYITIGDRTISNASKGQTGVITMQHALNWSLNTGMVTLAQRLGDGENITYGARKTMYSYLNDRFGLGERTGVELTGEVAGRIISPDEPDGNAVRYSNMSFGQGMDSTMMQVAAGFSSIVNGGKYYRPTVIAGNVNKYGDYTPANPNKVQNHPISKSASATAKKMIRDARRAFYAENDRQGFDVGGKTGTSQTLINGSYDNNQTVGTYIGYGGDSKPRYVIMIQVSAPGKSFSGNESAMPVFTSISNWMIDYMKLQPKG